MSKERGCSLLPCVCLCVNVDRASINTQTDTLTDTQRQKTHKDAQIRQLKRKKRQLGSDREN